MADYTGMKRHVGKLNNTDRRVVVVFMQVPGDEGKALVIDTDALPPRYHEPLMKLVDSAEGQQAQNLGEIMHRRLMTDTGADMLTTLHYSGYLQPVLAELVTMYPRPNMAVPLTKITSELKVEDVSATLPKVDVKENTNIGIGAQEDKVSMARNLLVEAELLETDARGKRELAYTYDPSLRPETKTERKPRSKKSSNESTE